jgi:hypothetical protein
VELSKIRMQGDCDFSANKALLLRSDISIDISLETIPMYDLEDILATEC